MSQIKVPQSPIKRKIIIRVVLGYLFALMLTLSIVFLALTRLNKINNTVDELTNRLAEIRSLSHDVISNLQLVNFYEDRYRYFYKQNDLDLFNEKLIDLKAIQIEIAKQVNHEKLRHMMRDIQLVTKQYEREFEKTTQLIMYQQSLISTSLIKQELLIENQLSAIRINVGLIQVSDIFLSFGNARNAFELMRLYQSKYLIEHNEKYFIMFNNNYKYASKAFSHLSSTSNTVSKNNRIALSSEKAKVALQAYYETFLKIHTASINLKKSSKNLNHYQLSIAHIGARIASEIEYEYKKYNKLTQKLVQQTKFELLTAVLIAIFLNLSLIFIVLQKIISPIFHDMKRLSNLDGLTKIANRRRFDACLQKEKERTKRENQALSLIMCDVDHFKLYNDTHGHQMGDVCLKNIANIINKACKRPGDLAARYGGEEFAIILPNTISDAAVLIANNIKNDIETLKIPHGSSSASSFITISMGVATIKEGDISIETLIGRADKALYNAKASGRNCIIKASD